MVDFAIKFEELLVWQKSRERSKDDFARFLYIAKGSGAEVRSQLYLALDLGYLSEQEFLELNDQSDHIVKLLTKFIQSLKRRHTI